MHSKDRDLKKKNQHTITPTFSTHTISAPNPPLHTKAKSPASLELLLIHSPAALLRDKKKKKKGRDQAGKWDDERVCAT